MKILFKNLENKDKQSFLFRHIESLDGNETVTKRPKNQRERNKVSNEVIEALTQQFSEKVGENYHPDNLKHALFQMYKKGDLDEKHIKDAKYITIVAEKLKKYITGKKESKKTENSKDAITG